MYLSLDQQSKLILPIVNQTANFHHDCNEISQITLTLYASKGFPAQFLKKKEEKKSLCSFKAPVTYLHLR